MPVTLDLFIEHTLPALIRARNTLCFILTTGFEPFEYDRDRHQAHSRFPIHVCAAEYTPKNTLDTQLGMGLLGTPYRVGLSNEALCQIHRERSEALRSLFDLVAKDRHPTQRHLLFVYIHGHEIRPACELMRTHQAEFPMDNIVMICEHTAYNENKVTLQLMIDDGTLAGLVVTDDADGRYVLSDLIEYL